MGVEALVVRRRGWAGWCKPSWAFPRRSHEKRKDIKRCGEVPDALFASRYLNSQQCIRGGHMWWCKLVDHSFSWFSQQLSAPNANVRGLWLKPCHTCINQTRHINSKHRTWRKVIFFSSLWHKYTCIFTHPPSTHSNISMHEGLNESKARLHIPAPTWCDVYYLSLKT